MKLPQKIFFDCNNEKLAGSLYLKNNNNAPQLFFLHGGGKTSSKQRTDYLSQGLLEKNITSFAFDFSGHGESTGSLENSSLKKRINEAKQAIRVMGNINSLNICGASMSGYVAIKILEFFAIDTLILFCPAIYAGKAFNVSFNEKFTNIIRKNRSWENSDALELLRKFRGKFLLVIGDKDEVIPEGVIKLIDQNTNNCKKKEIIYLPNCTHQIHNWLKNNKEHRELVLDKMINYLNNKCFLSQPLYSL